MKYFEGYGGKGLKDEYLRQNYYFSLRVTFWEVSINFISQHLFMTS